MRFYVYELIDPRTDEPFYVGKGSGDRISAHEQEARRGSPHPKCQHIREIWSFGLEVVRRRIRYFGKEADAYKFEAERIRAIGLHRLTNLCFSWAILPRRPRLPESGWTEKRFSRLAHAFSHVIRCMAQGDGCLYRSEWIGPDLIAQYRLQEAEEGYLSLLQEAIDALGISVVNRYLKAAGNVEVSLNGGN